MMIFPENILIKSTGQEGMNKMKFFVTLLLSILLLGCVSMYRYTDVNEFNPEEGYVGLHLNRNLQIFLKNLDTGEMINLDLRKKDSLIAFSIPPGDYAVNDITYYQFSLFGSTTYYLHIPLYLKTLIKVESNSITYLGDFVIDSKLRKGKFAYDYLFEETLQQIETEYYFDPNFLVKPLEQLSLENIEESHFDFHM